MPTFEPFTTISVPFPYVERLASKRRPALIVSRPQLARAHGLVWVLMTTSAANARWPDDIPIDDLKRAGLPKPSVVRPTKIATLETRHAWPIGERRLPPWFWRRWARCFRISSIALNEREGRKSKFRTWTARCEKADLLKLLAGLRVTLSG